MLCDLAAALKKTRHEQVFRIRESENHPWPLRRWNHIGIVSHLFGREWKSLPDLCLGLINRRSNRRRLRHVGIICRSAAGRAFLAFKSPAPTAASTYSVRKIENRTLGIKNR